ncbi:MAG: gliding motility-associated C-terminal domain-containing protein [Bacteroidia bacterium]|nr:gliding motility-associated C-terminal domain-containing protein [Bacteroidia bacterium]
MHWQLIHLIFLVLAFSLGNVLKAQPLPASYVLYSLHFNDPSELPKILLNSQQRIAGPNQWLMNNSYSGAHVENPRQDNVNSGNIFNAPQSGYLHVTNMRDTAIDKNAVFNPAEATDVVTMLNVNPICLKGFQKVEISFFWFGGGDGVNTYAEILYSLGWGGTPEPVLGTSGPIRLFGSPNQWKFFVVEVPQVAMKGDVRFYIRWFNSRSETGNNTPQPSFGIDDFSVRGTILKKPRIKTILDPTPTGPICQGGQVRVCFEHEFDLCAGVYIVRLSEPGGQFTPNSAARGFFIINPEWYPNGRFCTTMPIGQFNAADDCYKIRLERVTQVTSGGLIFPADSMFNYPVYPPIINDGYHDEDLPCFKVDFCSTRYFINTQPVPGGPGVNVGRLPTFMSRQEQCDVACVNSPLTVHFESYVEIWDQSLQPPRWVRSPTYLFEPGNEYRCQLLRIRGRDTTIVQEIGGAIQDPNIYPGPVRGDFGSFNASVPDVPDGCDYYFRVVSTRPVAIDASLRGPVCIKHCDIVTNNNRPVDICYSCNIDADLEMRGKGAGDPVQALFDWYICPTCTTFNCINCTAEDYKRILVACKDTVVPERAENHPLKNVRGALVPVKVGINRWPWPQNAPVRYNPNDEFEIQLWQPQPMNPAPPLNPNHTYPAMGDVDVNQTYGEIASFRGILTWNPSTLDPPPTREAILWLKIDPNGPKPAAGTYFFRIVAKRNPGGNDRDTIPYFYDLVPRPNCELFDNTGQFTTLSIVEPSSTKLSLMQGMNQSDCDGERTMMTVFIIGAQPGKCYEWYVNDEYVNTYCFPFTGLRFIGRPGTEYRIRVRERAGGEARGCFGPMSDEFKFTMKKGHQFRFALNEPPPFCLNEVIKYSVVFDTITPTLYTFEEFKFNPPDAGDTVAIGNNEFYILWKKEGTCDIKVQAIAKVNQLCELKKDTTFHIRSYRDPLPPYNEEPKQIYFCSKDSVYLLHSLGLEQMLKDTLTYGKSFQYGLWKSNAEWEAPFASDEEGQARKWSRLNRIETTPPLSFDAVANPQIIEANRKIYLPGLYILPQAIKPSESAYYLLKVRNTNGCVVTSKVQLNAAPTFNLKVSKDTLICLHQTLELKAQTEFPAPAPNVPGNWQMISKYRWYSTDDASFITAIDIPNPVVKPTQPSTTYYVEATVEHKIGDYVFSCETITKPVVVNVYFPQVETRYVCLQDSIAVLPTPLRPEAPGNWLNPGSVRLATGSQNIEHINNQIALSQVNRAGNQPIGISEKREVTFLYQLEKPECIDTLRLNVVGDPKVKISSPKPNPLKFFPPEAATNSFIDASIGNDKTKNQWTLWAVTYGDTIKSKGGNWENYTFIYDRKYSDTVKYVVKLAIENEYGCKQTDTLNVIVINENMLVVYNVFTPNNDGVNDRFVIENAGVKEFHISIFDRWGMEVFRSNDVNNFWDGTKFNDGTTLMQEGVYFYYIKGAFNTGATFTRSGNVTLLR